MVMTYELHLEQCPPQQQQRWHSLRPLSEAFGPQALPRLLLPPATEYRMLQQSRLSYNITTCSIKHSVAAIDSNG